MTLNKTDRIVISLGKQIVSGKHVLVRRFRPEAELCEEFETSGATSSAKCFVP